MLNYTFPSGLIANGMLSLASGINNQQAEILFKDVKLPELPPRDIDTILRLAEAGHSAEISVLEWITLLNGKEKWDALHAGRARSSNQLIWQTAIKNHGLRYLLYWRIVLFFDGQDSSLAKGLVQLFKEFRSELMQVDRQRTAIICGFQSKSYYQLSKLVLSLKATPKQVLIKCGLPGKTRFCNAAIKELPRFWHDNSSDFSTGSVLAVAKKLVVTEQDQFYSAVLTDIPSEKLKDQKALVSEIFSRYLPNKRDSRYLQLTSAAKTVIQELIGLMSFDDFKRLIDKLTSPDIAPKLQLTDWEIRQLHARVSFWSNYQARFLSFAVFLPIPTFSLLKQLNFHVDDGTLREMSNASCEVCVIEFADYFVMEFLRGSNSGARVIDKLESRSSLLNEDNILINQRQLESIPYEAEHDHLIYWQKSCEQMLRSEFRITPNSGLKKFLITSQSQNGRPFLQDYSFQHGLPELTDEQMSKRYEAINKSRMHLSRAHKFYGDSDFIGYEQATKLEEICRDVLAKYEYWIGFSKTHGWVTLDRSEPQNMAGSTRFRFFKLSNRTFFECNKSEWINPEFYWAPGYLTKVLKYSELNDACNQLIGLLKNVNSQEILKAFMNVIPKDVYNSVKKEYASKKIITGDNEVIAIALSHGATVSDFRNAGGKLKISLTTRNPSLQLLLLDSGFMEKKHYPLVFLKN
jgi:hypothetical protein